MLSALTLCLLGLNLHIHYWHLTIDIQENIAIGMFVGFGGVGFEVVMTWGSFGG